MEKWQVRLGELSADDGWIRSTFHGRFFSLFTTDFALLCCMLPFLYPPLYTVSTPRCQSAFPSFSLRFVDTLHRTIWSSCSHQFLLVQTCRCNSGVSVAHKWTSRFSLDLLIEMYRYMNTPELRLHRGSRLCRFTSISFYGNEWNSHFHEYIAMLFLCSISIRLLG